MDSTCEKAKKYGMVFILKKSPIANIRTIYLNLLLFILKLSNFEIETIFQLDVYKNFTCEVNSICYRYLSINVTKI